MDRILQTLEAAEGLLGTAAVGELLAHSPAGPIGFVAPRGAGPISCHWGGQEGANFERIHVECNSYDFADVIDQEGPQPMPRRVRRDESVELGKSRPASFAVHNPC